MMPVSGVELERSPRSDGVAMDVLVVYVAVTEIDGRGVMVVVVTEVVPVLL
jgi:hypothetical protein